jgi:hypothetical protein
MGMFSPSIANNPTSENSGKGSQPTVAPTSQIAQPEMQFPATQGKGGVSTNSATSGQAQMGDPALMQNQQFQQQRRFPNTIQSWDNANIQPQTQSGKGKG